MLGDAEMEQYDEAKNSGEISPVRLTNALGSTEHYLLVALENGQHNNSLILSRGDYIKCFNELVHQLLYKLEYDCDFDITETIRTANEVWSRASGKWLSEKSLNDEISPRCCVNKDALMLPRNMVEDALHVLGDSDLGRQMREVYNAQTKNEHTPGSSARKER